MGEWVSGCVSEVVFGNHICFRGMDGWVVQPLFWVHTLMRCARTHTYMWVCSQMYIYICTGCATAAYFSLQNIYHFGVGVFLCGHLLLVSVSVCSFVVSACAAAVKIQQHGRSYDSTQCTPSRSITAPTT